MTESVRESPQSGPMAFRAEQIRSVLSGQAHFKDRRQTTTASRFPTVVPSALDALGLTGRLQMESFVDWCTQSLKIQYEME